MFLFALVSFRDLWYHNPIGKAAEAPKVFRAVKEDPV